MAFSTRNLRHYPSPELSHHSQKETLYPPNSKTPFPLPSPLGTTMLVPVCELRNVWPLAWFVCGCTLVFVPLPLHLLFPLPQPVPSAPHFTGALPREASPAQPKGIATPLSPHLCQILPLKHSLALDTLCSLFCCCFFAWIVTYLRAGLSLFCFPIYLQCLEQCLAHRRCPKI